MLLLLDGKTIIMEKHRIIKKMLLLKSKCSFKAVTILNTIPLISSLAAFWMKVINTQAERTDL